MSQLFVKTSLLALLILGLLYPINASAQQDPRTSTKQLAPGVTFIQEIRLGIEPLIINQIRIDLKEKGVKVRYGQARDVISLEGETKGRELLPEIAARQGALVAINGDFAAYSADPLGLAIRDGELLSEPMDYRVCLGLRGAEVSMGKLFGWGAFYPQKGDPITLTGINRYPHAGDVVLWTPTYQGKLTAERKATVVCIKEASLPFKASQPLTGKVDYVSPYELGEPLPQCPQGCVMIVGVGEAGNPLLPACNVKDSVTIRYDLLSNSILGERGQLASRARDPRAPMFTPAWQEVEQAIGGGPWLVQNGVVAVDWKEQKFQLTEFVEKLHPRTAVGVTEDGKLMLVTVDGRQAVSQGASLFQMAEIMKRLGAKNAINLDGGGSTTMTIGGATVNSPSDGKLRYLANGLLVFGDTAPVPAVETYHIEPNPTTGNSFKLGDLQTFRVVDEAGIPISADIPIVWGTEEGRGFISQSGQFVAFRTGAVNVIASIGGKKLKAPVTVTP